MQHPTIDATQRGQRDRDHEPWREPTPPQPYEITRLPIAGVWREGRSGQRTADVNPSNGETLVEIASANAQDVDVAYSMAERVQKGWAAVSPQVRHTLLEHAALIMQIRKKEILDWLISESGSTFAKASFDWDLTYWELLESAAHTSRADGRMLLSSIRGKDTHVHRQPVGVVGVISPWNLPLHLSMRSVAPAIALGNTVVLEPATDTPVTGKRTAVSSHVGELTTAHWISTQDIPRAHPL